MYRFSTYKQQYKANLKLALPVVLTQLGQIFVQVADNLMVGRFGGDDPTPLAAVSFGGAVFFILFIAAVGIALGLTPLIGASMRRATASVPRSTCTAASSFTRCSVRSSRPCNWPSFR